MFRIRLVHYEENKAILYIEDLKIPSISFYEATDHYLILLLTMFHLVPSSSSLQLSILFRYRLKCVHHKKTNQQLVNSIVVVCSLVANLDLVLFCKKYPSLASLFFSSTPKVSRRRIKARRGTASNGENVKTLRSKLPCFVDLCNKTHLPR